MRKFLLLLLLYFPIIGFSQTPCTSEGFQQFDFWIGEWEVFSGDTKVGENTVSRILDSCVVQENWRGTSGSNGMSFNTYFPERNEWEQVWVDNSNSTIHFIGKLVDGNMVMKGSNTRGKAPILYRMTYFPNPNGTIRQLWEQSNDNGASWISIFDGLYKPKV